MICPLNTGLTFLICVAASSGRYLYMKIKNATEKKMLTVAIQPLISSFFLPGSSG